MKELNTFRKYLTEGEFKVGDKVTMKGGGDSMEITNTRKMLGSDLKAYSVKKSDGKTAEYDENQLELAEGKLLKEEQYSGAIIRKGSSDKAKEDTKIVRQALKKAGIKFTNRGEFGMNFKDADLAQIKKVIAGEKVGEFVVSRDVNEGVIEEDYKNDYANSEEDFTDEMVVEKIKDIIKYHELDPQDLIDEIRIEFGVDAMD